MITLQQLRDHAATKPDHLFPMNSCEHCLACDLLGEGSAASTYSVWPPGSYYPWELPPTFGAFVDALTDIDKTDEAPITGAKLVEAIDKLIAGVDPAEVAREALA